MRCNKCNLEIKDGNVCPFCHQVVDGNPPQIKSEYPPKQKKRQLPLRLSVKNIYLVIAVILAIVCITTNYLTNREVLWCWFIFAVFAYGYLLIANTIYSVTEIGAKIFLQGASLIGLSYIYDAIFDTSFSTSYCLPIIITSMIIVSGGLLILKSKFNKSLYLSNGLLSLLGFIPIILYATNCTDVMTPAIISAVCGGICLIATIIFGVKLLKEQSFKVFHF